MSSEEEILVNPPANNTSGVAIRDIPFINKKRETKNKHKDKNTGTSILKQPVSV